MLRLPMTRRNPIGLAAVPVVGYLAEHPLISLAAAGVIWWALRPQQVQQLGQRYGVGGIPSPPAWLTQQLAPASAATPPPPPGVAR